MRDSFGIDCKVIGGLLSHGVDGSMHCARPKAFSLPPPGAKLVLRAFRTTVRHLFLRPGEAWKESRSGLKMAVCLVPRKKLDIVHI